MGCSCDSEKCENKVTVAKFHDTRHKLQQEQTQTIEDVGVETMTIIYNSENAIEQEAAHLLDTFQRMALLNWKVI